MSELVMHSGAELAAHICAEAAARGITVARFLEPIFGRGAASRINTIRTAKVPTMKTVEQVNRILSNKVFMPTAAVREVRHLTHNRVIQASEPPLANAVYVHRDPCFRCGTRGDVGCRHQRLSHG